MTPGSRILLVILGVCALAAPSLAQTPQTTLAPSATYAPSINTRPVERLEIGQSTQPLNGPWKFTIGDSPIDPATGKLLWAEPGFEDSAWENVDLTAPESSIDPSSGFTGYRPGWTALGHPGYWGYAWYRIRVQLSVHSGQRLALSGPSDIDDAYQIYANGSLLGSFGDFSTAQPAVYYTQPMLFQLPLTGRSESDTHTEVLAFRVFMQPNSMQSSPDSGGLHVAPLIGDAGAVSAVYQIHWLQLIRDYITRPVEALFFLLLAIVSFSLILFDRSDRVYLWTGLVFLFSAASEVLDILGAWTQVMSTAANNIGIDVLVDPLTYSGWVMVWWVWFRLRRPSWIPRAVLALTLLLILSNALGEDLFYNLVPHPVAAVFHLLSLVARLGLMTLLIWIVSIAIREQGREGWFILPAVILVGISRFQSELSVLHVRLRWFPFGVGVNSTDLANLLLAAVLAILLLRRLMLSVREQRRLALDFKQAQEIQQVILPQARIVLPSPVFAGLIIESEYRPAREVGGDFFQIIPHATGGSVLIVAGDVAGKGLQAGMLVALLVGAIRSTEETTTDPLALLQALNRRMLGRGDAAATCLALRIESNGQATLANAGHLAPYRNGQALPVEGSLPLGFFEAAQFPVLHFTLNENDRLTLVSDGVLEATNPTTGELYGFDRTAAIATQTADQIAKAAEQFGQDDDITVLTITRLVKPKILS